MQKQTINKQKSIRALYGLGRLLGDLEEGSKEIAQSLHSSLKKSARALREKENKLIKKQKANSK